MSCNLHRRTVLEGGVPVRTDWYDISVNPPRKLDPAVAADAALIAAATEEGKCDGTAVPYELRQYIVGMENTGTRFNESHELTIENQDGSVTVVQMDPTANWGPQMQVEWPTKLAAAYPEACEVATHWINWKPGQTAPSSLPYSDIPQTVPRWGTGQFVQLTFCAADAGKVPVKATITASSNPARVGKPLVLSPVHEHVEQIVLCLTCCGDEIPKCAYPVGATLPTLPEAKCSSSFFELCDTNNETDPTLWTDIVMQVTTCDDGSQVTALYTVDTDGAFTDHTPVGDVVKCDTGEVFSPPVECTIEDALTTCGGCETAVQILNGRLSGTATYELVGPAGVEISAVGGSAFIAAYIAKYGGTSWAAPVEQIWACPCPPGAVGKPAGTYYVTFNGDTNVKLECVDYAKAPNAPPQELLKALLTVGCNDDRRDNLLQEMVDALTCDIEIPEKIAELADEQKSAAENREQLAKAEAE